MVATRSFEVQGGLAVLRLSDVPFDQATHKIVSAIALTRDLQIRKLLINALSVTVPPAQAKQGLFNKQWTSAANGVQVALVGGRELIDFDMLGVRCFASEEEAIAWLQL